MKLMDVLQLAANDARKLAMDAIAAAKSGHLGLPLGAAEIGAVLWGALLNYDPENPNWLNRDRLVLSAGHGSMWLYAWLHLAGFDLPIEEIKRFRQKDSRTPGHPEFGHTAGVECTTGPLGQGIANAVGLAVSSKMLAARLNTPDTVLIDHAIVCLCGDGCLQEGISYEAAALAGHWGLDNLICIYDSNGVTLDAMACESQSEDTLKRFEACGFEVKTVDGHDLASLHAAYGELRQSRNGKPKLIIAHTCIGRSISEIAGTPKAHGESGIKHIQNAQKNLGVSPEPFTVSEAVRTFFSQRKETLHQNYQTWQKRYETVLKSRPEIAQWTQNKPLSLGELVQFSKEISPLESPSGALATRLASEKVLQVVAQKYPRFISGSADLHGSTKNYIAQAGDFSSQNRTGRNIRFGIREHAMGAILNGLAYDKVFQPSGATFLVFSDYLRPSIRVAALSGLPVTYIFTHDSVAVGEDGPTHQPVETVQALRCIPNLDVIRPADAEETVGAYMAALQRQDGPTALILTRQDIPLLNNIPIDNRRLGVLQGAYIAKQETDALQLIILASGSELSLALAAAESIGPSIRVVSMPCMERFSRQPVSYRDHVLPPFCTKRISIEAGISTGWAPWLLPQGHSIGIEQFGFSAPGQTVLLHCGMSVETIIRAANTTLGTHP